MATSSDLKELHEKYFDPRKLMDRYIGQDSAFLQDAMFQIFPPFLKMLSSGGVKGGALLEVSMTSFIQYALAACEYFTEVTFACMNEKSMQELQKWLKNEPDALDWSHAVEIISELKGSNKSWMENENMLRRKVKQVLSCDVCKSNPLSPTVLPQADCLLLTHCVEFYVTDKMAFREALKNIASLLKCGGNLIMIVALETTFYMFGDLKFPHLCFDEGFLRSAVTDAGFVIKEQHVVPRKAQCLYDITDYGDIMLLNACKERDM